VQIEGHCDERGSTEYNLALGQRRADSAMQYLVSLGISANRLSTISFGKEKSLDSDHSESAWSKNRRAHFVLK
jgi:peptidoglycan-associated lipoprotein